MADRYRRALVVVGVAFVVSLSFLIYSQGLSFTPIFKPLNVGPDVKTMNECSKDIASYAVQPPESQPALRFRDNLRNDSNYITSWAVAGYTNQFMNHVNMIYLGLLTNRIPIIAPFSPTAHIGEDSWILPFGDVFDLDIFRKKFQLPVLEWRDVKILPNRDSDEVNSEVETIGCWTTVAENKKGVPEATRLVQHLGVDCSYTKFPLSVRLPSANIDNEVFVVLPQLAAAIFPESPSIRPDRQKVFRASNVNGHEKTPDEHLSCFDSLYYASSGVTAFEWEKSWSPAWQMVGRHLYFTREFKRLGQEYVRRALGIKEEQGDIPPFIALHIRHGDFGSHCAAAGKTSVDCFPPVSTYVVHIDAIKKKWLDNTNVTVTNVIVMSDEQYPGFWNDVASQGWSFNNHSAEKTVERLGAWYPTLIDTVIQSLAVGHVGTSGSTFTLVGERRVRDWNHGFASAISIRI